MTWESVLTKLDGTEKSSGQVADPFERLSVLENLVPVTVTMKRSEQVTMPGGNEGWVGCEVTVHVRAPQKEAYIDIAAELACKKALELVNDGLSLMGLSRLGE